jgi:hypothetical protein
MRADSHTSFHCLTTATPRSNLQHVGLLQRVAVHRAMSSASPSSDSCDSSISYDDVLRLLMTTPANWLAPRSPSLAQVMRFLLDTHLTTTQHRPGCEHEVSALHDCLESLVGEIDADLLRVNSKNAPGLSIKIFVSTALQQRLQQLQPL